MRLNGTPTFPEDITRQFDGTIEHVFYVDANNGNDAEDGRSFKTAKATINGVNGVMPAVNGVLTRYGGTARVYLMGQFQIPQVPGVSSLNFSAYPTSGKRVSFVGLDNPLLADSYARIIINDPGGPLPTPFIAVSAGSNVSFENIKFTFNLTAGAVAPAQVGIQNQSSWLSVRRCHLEMTTAGLPTNTVVIHAGNFIDFSENTVHCSNPSAADIIYLFDAGSRGAIIVRGNRIECSFPAGATSKVIAVPMSGWISPTIIEDNVIFLYNLDLTPSTCSTTPVIEVTNMLGGVMFTPVSTHNNKVYTTGFANGTTAPCIVTVPFLSVGLGPTVWGGNETGIMNYWGNTGLMAQNVWYTVLGRTGLGAAPVAPGANALGGATGVGGGGEPSKHSGNLRLTLPIGSRFEVRKTIYVGAFQSIVTTYDAAGHVVEFPFSNEAMVEFDVRTTQANNPAAQYQFMVRAHN